MSNTMKRKQPFPDFIIALSRGVSRFMDSWNLYIISNIYCDNIIIDKYVIDK